MKRCKECGEVKALDDFYRASGMRDGRRSDCWACNLAKKKAWYAEHRDEAIERVKAWQQANPRKRERFLEEYKRSGRRAVSSRKSYLKRTYGLTPETYDALLVAQEGVCAICDRAPEGDELFHVDHHHGDGEVRGLLCGTCNRGLGQFQDDADLLREAARYVEGHEGERLGAATRARVASLVGR